MIKLPTTIVIYPQKKSIPRYLLCWIPANDYPRVVIEQEKRTELGKLYPQGVEIELSPEGLAENGVALEVGPEDLQRAYLDLLAGDQIPDSGMVELAPLMDYLGAAPTGSFDDVIGELGGAMDPFAVDEGGLLKKIKSPPPMSEGDEAADVYRRLDVQQSQSHWDDQKGG